MNARERAPQWWRLYLLIALGLALFWPESHLNLSAGGHTAVQLALLALLFGLTARWLAANRGAMLRQQWDERRDQSAVVPVAPDTSAAAGAPASAPGVATAPYSGLFDRPVVVAETGPEGRG